MAHAAGMATDLRMLSIVVTFLIINLTLLKAGHEVMHKFIPAHDDIKAIDLAIIQFETRSLSDYWNISAYWNSEYALRYGHRYHYLKMESKCTYASFDLSPAWCKVKAMILANQMIPEAKAYVYLDSDAVVTANYSLTDIIAFMRKDLNWDQKIKPFAFNQDGPGWSCKFTMKQGYKLCLNSGTVFWIKGHVSSQILEYWWNSAGDEYGSNLFPSKWRAKWPWEQAQMYKVYEKFKDNIMILSFPKQPFLPWTSKKNPKSHYPTDTVEPWCFSHWPGANCFITHWCSAPNQKKKLRATFALENVSKEIIPMLI